MKKCTLCKEEKELDLFGINNARKDGYQSFCKVCAGVRNRAQYAKTKNSPRHSINNANAHRKRRDLHRQRLSNYVGGIPKCSSCGWEEDLWEVFDWHHLDEKTKSYEISSMVRHTEERLYSELGKCILLCSNCHRRLHANEKN